jgi:hypothetical protein
MHGTFIVKVMRYMMMHFVMKIVWDSTCRTLGVFFLQFMCHYVVQELGVAYSFMHNVFVCLYNYAPQP